MTSVTRVVLVVLFVSAAANAQAPAPCREPLSEMEISELLAGKVAEARIVQLITACGVGFNVDRAAENRLKNRGATDAVLIAARQKSPATNRTPSVQPPRSREEEAWNAIKDSASAYVIGEFIDTLKQGALREAAIRRHDDLIKEEYRPEIEAAIRDRRWPDGFAGTNELQRFTRDRRRRDDELRNWINTMNKGIEIDEAIERERGTRSPAAPAPRGIIWLYRPNPLNVDTDCALSETILECETSPWIMSRVEELARLRKGRFFGLSVPAREHYFHWRRGYIGVTVPPSGQVFIRIDHLPEQSAQVVDAVAAEKDFRELKPVESREIRAGTTGAILGYKPTAREDIITRSPFN